MENETATDVIKDTNIFSNLRIIKNVLLLSLAFLLICTSVDGLQMLQSTLNRDEGIGVVSIAIQFAFGCITALFFMKYFILKLGTKMTLTFCILAHIPSTVANFYPYWITMIPSYAILGIAATLLWGSNSTYLNDISNKYANNFKPTNMSYDNELSYQNINKVSSKEVNSDNNYLKNSNSSNDTHEINYSGYAIPFGQSISPCAIINHCDISTIEKNTKTKSIDSKNMTELNKFDKKLTMLELANTTIQTIACINKLDSTVSENLPVIKLNSVPSENSPVAKSDSASSENSRIVKFNRTSSENSSIVQLDSITSENSHVVKSDSTPSENNPEVKLDSIPSENSHVVKSDSTPSENSPGLKLDSVPLSTSLLDKQDMKSYTAKAINNLDRPSFTINSIDKLDSLFSSTNIPKEFNNAFFTINTTDKLDSASSAVNAEYKLSSPYIETNLISEFSQTKARHDQRDFVSLLIESTTARFFGIHSMFYQSGHIWSNIVSYYVLQQGVFNNTYIHDSSCMCGADFCNIESECFESNLKEPSKEVKYLLISIFLALNVVAVLLTAIFLDPLEGKRAPVHYSMDFAMATFNQLKRPLQMLIVPLSIYMGMSQGFFYADFPKAFVGCAWGMHHVGLVTIAFGITCSATSTLSGWLVKHLGRQTIFLIAAVINVAVNIIMLLWIPDSDQPIMFFVVAGMWGALMGSFWSQLKAFHGVLFKNNEEAAFGCYELSHSIGACVSFACSNYICLHIKIYMLLAVSSVGMIGYLLAEKIRPKNK